MGKKSSFRHKCGRRGKSYVRDVQYRKKIRKGRGGDFFVFDMFFGNICFKYFNDLGNFFGGGIRTRSAFFYKFPLDYAAPQGITQGKV